MLDSLTARCQTCNMHGGHKMQCPQRTDAGLRVAVDGSALPDPAAGEPELPEPDTHCFDDDTGKDVWSHSPDQLRAYGQAMAEHVRREALEEAAAWRPMETAPADGTNLLLLNRAGNVAAGLWQDSLLGAGWFLRGGSRPDVFFNDNFGPVGWLPIPGSAAPPQGEQT